MLGPFSIGVTCCMELAESHRNFSDLRRLCMAPTADIEADCLVTSAACAAQSAKLMQEG